jgi:hypothetical protein
MHDGLTQSTESRIFSSEELFASVDNAVFHNDSEFPKPGIYMLEKNRTRRVIHLLLKDALPNKLLTWDEQFRELCNLRLEREQKLWWSTDNPTTERSAWHELMLCWVKVRNYLNEILKSLHPCKLDVIGDDREEGKDVLCTGLLWLSDFTYNWPIQQACFTLIGGRSTERHILWWSWPKTYPPYFHEWWWQAVEEWRDYIDLRD